MGFLIATVNEIKDPENHLPKDLLKTHTRTKNHGNKLLDNKKTSVWFIKQRSAMDIMSHVCEIQGRKRCLRLCLWGTTEGLCSGKHQSGLVQKLLHGKGCWHSQRKGSRRWWVQILCLLGWIVGERYFWQVKPFGNPGKTVKCVGCRESEICCYRGAFPLATNHRNVMPALRMNFTNIPFRQQSGPCPSPSSSISPWAHIGLFPPTWQLNSQLW